MKRENRIKREIEGGEKFFFFFGQRVERNLNGENLNPLDECC